jgi:hypothetical protein
MTSEKDGNSSLCVLTILALAIKLGCVDDFWVDSDSVFIIDFWDYSSLCAMMISALVIELGCVDDFWVGSDSIFVNDF